MVPERLAELQENYKDRNLLEELVWGTYANHSGYTSKQDGEFLNWLCLMAHKSLKERPTDEWIRKDEVLKIMCEKCPVYNCVSACNSYRSIEKMSSVQSQTPTMKGGEE